MYDGEGCLGWFGTSGGERVSVQKLPHVMPTSIVLISTGKLSSCKNNLRCFEIIHASSDLTIFVQRTRAHNLPYRGQWLIIIVIVM